MSCPQTRYPEPPGLKAAEESAELVPNGPAEYITAEITVRRPASCTSRVACLIYHVGRAWRVYHRGGYGAALGPPKCLVPGLHALKLE